MIRSTDITDYYENRHGEWLRRWSIDDQGQPQCVEDALFVANLDQSAIDAQEAANAVVRQTIETVEAYEAAVRLSAGEEPPETSTTYDEAGEPSETDNPAHADYLAALATVEAVSAETLELAQRRNGTWVEPVEEMTDE